VQRLRHHERLLLMWNSVVLSTEIQSG